MEVAAASSSAARSGALWCGVWGGVVKPIHATEAFRLSVMPRRCCGVEGWGREFDLVFGSCCQGWVGGCFVSRREYGDGCGGVEGDAEDERMMSLASGTLNGIR